MTMHEEDAAKLAIVRQFQQVALDYQASLERQKNLANLQAHETEIQTSITGRANDCYAAARVLGFDLIAALVVFQQSLAQTPSSEPPVIAPQAAPQQIIAPARAIWEMVLDIAKAAFPEPVRAAAIQAEIERQRGMPLHYKTVGMSLYRLSRQGLMRRKGQKDWFFVPQTEGAKNPGADTPGQDGLFED